MVNRQKIFEHLGLEITAVVRRFANQWWRQPRRDGPMIVFFTKWYGSLPDAEELERMVSGVRFSVNRARVYEANAVIFHVPDLNRLPWRKPKGQLWIAWSQESSANCPRLRDPAFLSRIDLTMTYRQDASVWIPYFVFYPSHTFLDTLLRPPPPKIHDRLIASFISSPIDKSGRVAYLTELSRYLDLHAYGRVGRNRTLDNDQGHASKLDAIASYKFTIAFENSIDEDYVTEKFFDPLVAGSIPVYLGAPNIEDFAPGDHCYINVRDFSSPQALAEYLLYLNEDDTAYQAYFVWKHQPVRPGFKALYDRFLSEHSWMRLSRLVRERIGRE